MSVKKQFNLDWMFECPDAVLTCSTLECGDDSYLVFGGHDKTLYLMNEELNILDSITFDGWVRTTFPIDITKDGCQEVLVGAGDGNFLVVKFVKGINKLAGIMNYKSKGKVLCVSAGDFTRNGNIELIHGSEDKTLKIFENIDSTEPKYIFYFDSWVTACVLGYLKLVDVNKPIYGLLIGTKNGMLQLIQFKEDKPDIIWQKDFGSQINTIEVGDVKNDGFNEIVVGTDAFQLLILNSEGDELKSIILEEGRPISLKLVDIDGDNAKEIIVGCADGTLRIYHNTKLDSIDLELKWKAKAENSIKIVSTMKDPKEGLTRILIGGYDRSIRCICDFEWGKKPPLEIPNNIVEPQPIEAEPKVEKPIKFESVPTNIREYIFKYLIDNKIILGIAKELEKRGYLTDSVVEEFQRMISEKSDSFEKITYSVWTLPEDKIGLSGAGAVGTPKKKGKKLKPVVIEQEMPSKKGGALIDALKKEPQKTKGKGKKIPTETIAEVNIRTIITTHLEKQKLIQSKTKLVDDLVILGYERAVVEKQLDKLRMEGVIVYSRSEPKGWSLGNI